ncbi:hypothetical protein OXPF_27120 [Oxobacter pfennigii]|uniref:Uncharacterized protein n=1 Tax=Oxobacter pfennigii TaxID=36849 RepID=A0A0P8W541_9CLOT|nr:hypothetical protein OXPF_27120 [Oxobacter pfennigii]
MHPVIIGIGNIDIAITVHRYARGIVKLTGTVPAGSPFRQQSTGRAEHSNPIGAGVCNINISGTIHGNSLREVKLAVTGSQASPLQYKFAVGIKLLYPVVIVVEHIDISTAVNSYISWAVKLAITIAVTGSSPYILRLECRVELLHSMVLGFNHINVAITVYSDS